MKGIKGTHLIVFPHAAYSLATKVLNRCISIVTLSSVYLHKSLSNNGCYWKLGIFFFQVIDKDNPKATENFASENKEQIGTLWYQLFK